MAILKPKLIESGVTGNYWKILRVQADKERMVLHCTIALFLDEAASQAGRQSLPFKKVYIFPITKQEAASNLIALGYDKIKAQSVAPGELLHGAEDLI